MFKLARELHMTVARLGQEMPSSEFTEWMAFYVLEEEERRSAEAEAKVNARMGARGRRR
jgi:hypothetical protein